MPLPHDELLRLLPSPVPAHTSFGLFCETATEPTEATDSLSNTPAHVVPLFVVRSTPPVPTPTNIVYGVFSTTAKSEMRPPMLAGPMARHFSGRVSSAVCENAVVARRRSAGTRRNIRVTSGRRIVQLRM